VTDLKMHGENMKIYELCCH